MTHQKRLSIVTGVIGALAVSGVALFAHWGPAAAVAPAAAEQIRGLGTELLGRSMIIFETAGVTILTAMIAATAVAMPALQRKKTP